MHEKNRTSGELLDKLAIADLVQLERLYRDQHQWDQLRASYHPDALIRTGWFTGTIDEFIASSRRLASRKAGWHLTHITSPTQVQVKEDRAIAETNTLIIIRTELLGAEADITTYCHLFSRVERREGQWKLLTLDVIYEKDTIAPVYPSDRLELNRTELKQGPAAYRFTAYNLRKLGYTVPNDLYTTSHPEMIAQLYRETRAWLCQQE